LATSRGRSADHRVLQLGDWPTTGPNRLICPAATAYAGLPGMRKVLDSLRPEDSGRFWSYDGTNIPR